MSKQTKTLSLALQGGGAHGAFAWGVLDRLLEDGRIQVEAITATSAGSMNGVVLAYGLATGGVDEARLKLADYWEAVAKLGERISPMRPMPWEVMLGSEWDIDRSWSFFLFDTLTRMMSPYQLNPNNYNPLRTLIEEKVDFDLLRAGNGPLMFISATNVRSGRVRVFRRDELTADVVLASACLPYLFQAVEIDGEYYWDGGFLANPALFPVQRSTQSPDLLILHLNPLERAELPERSHEIFDRVNEISFNASLLCELRTIGLAQKVLDNDWIKPEFRDRLKRTYIHAIRADDHLGRYGVGSKLSPSWTFMQALRDAGREAASVWLEEDFQHVGARSSVDMAAEYLDPHDRGWWRHLDVE
ncbi:patatin-like phospholipase family protein [Chitinibacteraceae bacterium HSL-7]